MTIDFDLIPVRQQDKSVLRNLLELCHHDYSEFNGMDVDEHGLYGYPYLDHYWTEPGRSAFFMRISGKLAGFVMVRALEDGTHTIAEFFVLRKYRRLGVGKAAARRTFDCFPGAWSIDQEPGNALAQRFWRQVIGEYTADHFEEDVRDIEGEARPNQRFTSGSK